eukprot:CAMPEP_0173080940 /NCGR_PEP_ID=MMETSP1102-20130122/16727_1 /TAXON_ID=49646 /ORGANISM="Geminigera sp., Strain Caron Lab Isolate" /LENGTH=174 /DNA_ID=CAMNT_0013954927 /DNA_START=141 /DNA_END=665 /DNA_ORIENTATION=-
MNQSAYAAKMQSARAASRIVRSIGFRHAPAVWGLASSPANRAASSFAGWSQHKNIWRAAPPGMPVRAFALSAAELDKKMGEVNDLFVEARELIADALDSQGSTYFEDDLDDAQHAVKECVTEYDTMLSQLDEPKKGETMRLMGMKMEQLKGEMNLILDSLTHDEELPTSDRKHE